MLNIFASLKSLVKLQRTSIDNVIFQLHYKATVLILGASCIAISTRQFLGDPIHCTVPTGQIRSSIIDSYCWIHSTFTLPNANGRILDSEVPHQGVDKFDPGDTRMYHAYYQWVCFVLLLQAAMFYVPRWLWKSWEGGRIVHLMLDLDKPVNSEEDNKNKSNRLAEYLYHSFRLLDGYAVKFFLCEMLNLANVVGQIYFINRFLDGEFMTYGTDVLAFMETDQEDRVDPMMEVFPRVTKCTFRAFGPSGDIQRFDSLCVLPLNIINEKIYVFLWFWFIFLSIISTCTFVYRLLIVILPRLRFVLLKARAKMVDSEKLHTILREGSIGDWFLLYMLGKNMDPLNFKEVVNELYTRIADDIVADDIGNEMEDSVDSKSTPV